VQAIIGLVGGLTEQARQAKELRKTLSDVDPQNADKYKGMGLSELRGTVSAMELSQKKEAFNAMRQQQQLAMQRTGQEITDTARRQRGEDALTSALRGAQPPVTNTPMSAATGMPGASPFNVNVPTQGQPSASALVTSILQNPEAANTPGGQAILREWLQNNVTPPQSATVGGVPIITQGRTFVVDPRYKYQQQEQAREALKPQPGTGPMTSGDYFWTGKEWRAKPAAKGRGDITKWAQEGGAGAPQSQTFQPKAGQRVRQNGVLYEFDGEKWNEVALPAAGAPLTTIN
jgi:hypothetical protein